MARFSLKPVVPRRHFANKRRASKHHHLPPHAPPPANKSSSPLLRFPPSRGQMGKQGPSIPPPHILPSPMGPRSSHPLLGCHWRGCFLPRTDKHRPCPSPTAMRPSSSPTPPLLLNYLTTSPSSFQESPLLQRVEVLPSSSLRVLSQKAVSRFRQAGLGDRS